MLIFPQILFWVFFAGLFHNYVFYPFLLKVLSGKKGKPALTTDESKLPFVSVLIPVYNEEKVIKEKLESIIKQDYPLDKIRVFVASDNSTDKSDSIIKSFAEKHKHILFYHLNQRNGKPGVVNVMSEKIFELYPMSNDHIILFTDANVMLEKSTIRNLCRHFVHPEIAIVDSNKISVGLGTKGISKSENTYLTTETMMKNREGLLWGLLIGTFGGCYTLRSTFFEKIPDNFLVDDFFLTMRTLENGGKAINDLEALCYEDVSNDIKEEYRRKSRISAGNYQNLKLFRKHVFPRNKLSFAFFSHKVLRWIGPFLIIGMFFTCLYLSLYMGFYQLILAGIILILFVIPLLDFVLKIMGINFLFFRNIRYFVFMNVALFEGFIKYIKGIKNNVWEPTKRNQYI